LFAHGGRIFRRRKSNFSESLDSKIAAKEKLVFLKFYALREVKDKIFVNF